MSAVAEATVPDGNAVLEVTLRAEGDDLPVAIPLLERVLRDGKPVFARECGIAEHSAGDPHIGRLRMDRTGARAGDTVQLEVDFPAVTTIDTRWET